MNETRGLWRGKVKDDIFPTHNGEWVEGYYNDLFTPQIRHVVDKIYYDVIPSTLGECTGLRDKNGRLIFEGDIVNCKSISDNANMVVIFECGQFRMVCAEDYSSYQTDSGYYNINCFEKEIIGNIHDNSELLKTTGEDI